jgi:hypothetical protein
MNLKGNRVKLLSKDLERLLKLLSALQNTKELNETIQNNIN